MNNVKTIDKRYELLWRLLRRHIVERSFVKTRKKNDTGTKKYLNETRPGKV